MSAAMRITYENDPRISTNVLGIKFSTCTLYPSTGRCESARAQLNVTSLPRGCRGAVRTPRNSQIEGYGS